MRIGFWGIWFGALFSPFGEGLFGRQVLATVPVLADNILNFQGKYPSQNGALTVTIGEQSPVEVFRRGFFFVISISYKHIDEHRKLLPIVTPTHHRLSAAFEYARLWRGLARSGASVDENRVLIANRFAHHHLLPCSDARYTPGVVVPVLVLREFFVSQHCFGFT